MVDEHAIEFKVKGACERIRGSKVLKHSDRSTIAIPDFTVSALGLTAWVEMKFQRPGVRLVDIVRVDQLVMCNDLHAATRGLCWIVVFKLEPCVVTVWTPRALFAHLYPSMAPDNPFGTPGCKPAVADSFADVPQAAAALETLGAIEFKGWDYDIVAKFFLAHYYARNNAAIE